MAKYLFNINDVDSDTKEITGCKILRDEQEILDPAIVIETQDQEFFMQVRDVIIAGGTLTYPVSAGDPDDMSDLTVQNIDSLQIAKTKAYSSAAMQISQRFDNTLVVFDFYQLMVMNNIFIDKGYVVTDQNREQIYLDVLNSGNEAYLTILEKYLEIRDRIESINSFYKKFLIFQHHLKLAETIEEVRNIYDTFLSYFN